MLLMKDSIKDLGTSLYGRKDLLYDYSWLHYHPTDPRISGVPNDTVFNRSQGMEVLYLINAFAQKRGFRSKSSCCKLEKILHLYVPPTVRRQDEIIAWIEDNWFNFM